MLSCSAGIAYTVPDLDAVARLNLVTADGTQISCLQAAVSNGITVDQVSVAWVLAVITGLGLIASIVLSIIGHTDIATNIYFRTLLFLGFMQTQAIAGMSSVSFPPIVQSWTSMFQWTMGIVGVNFLQTICTWFQRATGGTPASLLTITEESVFMAKRAVPDLTMLARRSTDTTNGGTEQTVRGIERMGYRASIERTNIFMTGYLFFYFVTVCIVLVTIALQFGLSWYRKKKKNPKLEQETGATIEWKTSLRGCLFRIVSLGFPQMCVLCLWELIERDSAAEIVLAVTMWLSMIAVLGFATFSVFRRALASRGLHERPAYALYSDPRCFTKWGVLYTSYHPEAYYFAIPILVYTVAKGAVTAFAQSNPIAQSIVLLILETAMLLAVAIIKPFVDKAANGFGITAAVLNFLSSIFLLIFSDVFDQPAMMTSILGVLWCLYNAAFTLALLIWLLIGFYSAITLKAPTTRYNRISGRFENRIAGELLPLENSARGEKRPPDSRWEIDESDHARSAQDLSMTLSDAGSRYDIRRATPTLNSQRSNNRTPLSSAHGNGNGLEPTLPLMHSGSEGSGSQVHLSQAHPS